MERYQNLNGDSGVTHFEAGADFIQVRFRDGGLYTYDSVIPGARHVEAMKALAHAGRGLSSYISRNVRTAYARKDD